MYNKLDQTIVMHYILVLNLTQNYYSGFKTTNTAQFRPNMNNKKN